MLPLPKWMGRPERHSRRSIVDAILYVVRTGCSWRQLPVDFPPWPTVYWHFTQFSARGVTEHAEPSAGIIDSQSVKGPRRDANQPLAGHRLEAVPQLRHRLAAELGEVVRRRGV